MKNFWLIVNEVINRADVLLLVLDARFVNETRNKEIENKVKNLKKPLIYVLTKCDLVSKDIVEKYKNELNPSVFISAKEHQGTNILREKMIIEAKRAGIDKKPITVGVLGYPNVGKSSLINAMKGKKSAPTSILSGYTKRMRKVKADNRIVFFDTPGVIPYKEKNEISHAFIGTIDFTKAKDQDIIVIELMNRFPGRVESFYGVEIKEDKEESIEEIALKRKILKKGNMPDISRVATMILKDWQKGLITV